MFTWDATKAIANFDKHGVAFEEAATVFVDPDGLQGADVKHSQHEARFFRLGKSALGRILTIIFTVRRLSDGKETIRIISARCASRRERQAYDRQ